MKWIFLIWLLAEMVAQACGKQELEFLHENREILVSTVVKNERATIVYPLNGTQEQIATSFAKINLAYQTYRNLGLFTTENGYKQEFYNALEIGTKNFGKAAKFLKHAYSYLSAGGRQPDSSCLFYGNVLPIEDILLDSNEINLAVRRLGATWTPAIMDTNESHIALFYNFINTYNTVANDWFERSDDAINQYDMLRGGDFPITLKGHLETASCMDDASHEHIEVLECYSNTQALICEIEVSLPSTLTPYILLEKINYHGAQIRGPKGGEMFVKNPTSQAIQMLNCTNKDVPLCAIIEDEHDCLPYLLHHDLDKAILN